MRINVSRMHNLKDLVITTVYCEGEKKKAVRVGRKWFCTHCGRQVRLVD